MEDYLQNLQSLRSQMNDIESASTKTLAEEQRHNTSIEALEKDILSVTSETTSLNVNVEELEKENAQISSQVLECQKKISYLENEISTLSQSLELLRQQTVSATTGLEEKRLYFAQLMEDQVLKLQQRHDWLNSYNQKIEMSNTIENMSVSRKTLIAEVHSKKTKWEELEVSKSQLYDEISKSKLLIAQLKQKTATFPSSLNSLNIEALEDEHRTLLTDEAGELEYLKSLEDQIKQVKAISHAVKCECGEEYMVEMLGQDILPGI